MPRDSSGNYSLPTGNPVIVGTTITSDWANGTMTDIAAEITNSLSRTGQGGMLAPLLFADGTNVQPSITFILDPTLGFFRQSSGVMGWAGVGEAAGYFNSNTKQIEAIAAAPVAPQDLSRKDYVDNQIAAAVAALLIKPIGALEFGYDPNGILTGTWTQLPEGTFIMNTVGGADVAGGSNNAVVISHTHTITHTHSIAHNHASTTSGSTTASHTHSIAHDHPSVTSGSTTASHTHSINHNHAAVTSANNNRTHTHSIAHDHASVTSGGGGSHTHTYSVQAGSGGGGNVAFSTQTTAGASGQQGILNTVSNHTHSVNLPNYTGNSGDNSRTHTHSVDLPNFTGTSGSGGASHTHSVNVAAYTGNSGSGGASHTHTVDLPNYTGNSGASSAANTGSTGVSGNNLNKPLYKGVVIFERTA